MKAIITTTCPACGNAGRVRWESGTPRVCRHCGITPLPRGVTPERALGRYARRPEARSLIRTAQMGPCRILEGPPLEQGETFHTYYLCPARRRPWPPRVGRSLLRLRQDELPE